MHVIFCVGEMYPMATVNIKILYPLNIGLKMTAHGTNGLPSIQPLLEYAQLLTLLDMIEYD